jgi:NitT/TauT family transport system substrate-binding protein
MNFPLKTLASALVLSTSLAAASPGAAADDSLVVRLDFGAWGIHGAMHLAQEKGWFEEAGLKVDIQDGTGSGNTIQLVGVGQVEVGQVQLGIMAVARENDLPVRSFAGWFRKSDLAVLVPRGSGIDTIEDLRGKTVVCFTASPWTPYIDSFLDRGGLARDDINLLMVAPPSLISTYVSGQADGVMTPAPFGMPIVESTRPSQAILMADAGIAFPSYGLIASEETIAAKGDALRRLVEVQARAWEYIYEAGNIDEAVQAILSQREGVRLDPDVLRGQMEHYRDFVYTEASAGLPHGVQTRDDWEKALRDMEDIALIGPGWNPDDYFTNVFFED